METKKMSSFVATATAGIFAANNPVAKSQLARVVEFESARWLPSLLSELRSLEVSGVDIPGVGDFRVAHRTADNVRRLLIVISGTSVPEPRLAPFSGGGVALTCSIGNRELTFTTYPDHEDFVFSRTDDNDELADDGIVSLEQRKLGEVITTFLAR